MCMEDNIPQFKWCLIKPASFCFIHGIHVGSAEHFIHLFGVVYSELELYSVHIVWSF